MTCLVAIRDAGRVYMGADSCVSYGSARSSVSEPKLWKPRDWLGVAVSGSVSFMNMVRYRVAWPEFTLENPCRWLHVTFLDELKRLFDSQSVNPFKDEPKEPGGSLLIGLGGDIFTVETVGMQVTREHSPIICRGSGADVALGSLFETGDLPPLLRIAHALGAAAHWQTDCAEPFVFETV